jgi:hypothetical protein
MKITKKKKDKNDAVMVPTKLITKEEKASALK